MPSSVAPVVFQKGGAQSVTESLPAGELDPAGQFLQNPPLTCHWALKPFAVTELSLVNLTIMIPVVDVQMSLEETEPLSLASSDDEPHDVAPLDDSQLYTYTKSEPLSVVKEGKEIEILLPSDAFMTQEQSS